MKLIALAGTRPEAIKMIPVVKELKRNSSSAKFCIVYQHEKMLEQVLEVFDIQPDVSLKIPSHRGNLAELTSYLLIKLYDFLSIEKPDRIVVQGDTSTSFVGSLAAFYHHIPVAHIEAGLRSHHIYSPWPEEINRKLIAHIADLHFAPTLIAKENLIKEGVKEENIYITGNTGIDALNFACNYLDNKPKIMNNINYKFSWLKENKKLILVTSHRRENYGKNIKSICYALKALANRSDVQIVYLLHLNPNIYQVVQNILENLENIYLLEPQDYLSCIYLMQKSYLIMTDSGGLQEEAPSMGKPVLVLRESTERQEGILNGIAKIVGVDEANIIRNAQEILEQPERYASMCAKFNPYGDGFAAQRIADIFFHLANKEKN